MPIYTYKCTNEECGREADKLLSLSDRSESIICSECGKTAFKIVSLPAPAKFNGKDWTDKFYNKETHIDIDH